MIPFNIPTITGKEKQYLSEVLNSTILTGDGPFVHRCRAWFERQLGCQAALLTGSCTQALELVALLADIGPGDEVVMPSFTFVSTASAFALRGATIVFVDVRPDTMNMDESRLAEALTTRTRLIVPVHYGGVSCDMNAINGIAQAHGALVVEDAAQGLMCTLEEKPLGTIGVAGAMSFHATKNYNSGEGGLLILNDDRWLERAEILREKGTNRKQFFRGQVDKYTWVDLGSSAVFDELRAAFLWAQLQAGSEILADRMDSWRRYATGLAPLVDAGTIEVQHIPLACQHNAHLFYIKTADLDERKRLIAFLKAADIYATFHYVPLHSSPAGQKYGRFAGEDRHTTRESERLLRLPLFYRMSPEQTDRVIERIRDFYR